MAETTRFAPSPTGYLHLGHAYAAAFAAKQAQGGHFLLRIEDIDPTRCKPEFTAAIFVDLGWMGLQWQEPVLHQSTNFSAYTAALAQLQHEELLYPCFCTRKAIQAELAQAGQAPHGPEGTLYPGTCRDLSPAQRAEKIASGISYCWRLDMAQATRRTGALRWHDAARGVVAAQPERFGDIVLARKETPVAYHLAVVVDDAAQGVTLVTRGEDLLAATDVQRVLQALLRLPEPAYHHHRLLCDTSGRRFAKRDQSVTLRQRRADGAVPLTIWQEIGMI